VIVVVRVSTERQADEGCASPVDRPR